MRDLSEQHVYNRIAYVADVSRDEARDFCEDLRGYGIEVQTHGDEQAIVKTLIALDILFPSNTAKERLGS